MEKTNIEVRFKIYADEFPIDEVTKLLEIQPTEFYIKGSKGKYTVIKETSWYLGISLESLDVNEHLLNIVSILNDKKGQLIQLKNNYHLSYLFSAEILIKENQSPAFYLNQEVIAFANDIKAEFDFDLYVDSST